MDSQWILVLFVVLIVFVYGQEVWSWFEHSGWNDGADPDPNAKITSMNPQKVKYLKNGAKFRTRVEFSDGFWFVTHQTDRKQHFMSYSISIDAEAIAKSAQYSHDRAVEKKQKKAQKREIAQEKKQESQERKPETPPVQPVPLQPEPKPAAMILRITSGPMTGRVFQGAAGKSVVIGRNPAKCNLPLSQYPRISGVHCRIDFDENGARVTDLGSTNGTYVNGSRIAPGTAVKLEQSSQLSLADLTIDYHTELQ